MAKAGRGADQYMVRFPPGLRDRIKAYAERRGTSINSEIIRILERHFPEPWPVEKRLDDLMTMLSMLESEFGGTRLDQFVDDVEKTVRGIISGRVRGLDVETRERVRSLYEAWKEAELRHGDDEDDLDDEEAEAMARIGFPEKYSDPSEDE